MSESASKAGELLPLETTSKEKTRKQRTSSEKLSALASTTTPATIDQANPMAIIQMAVSQGADVEKLEKLMALQERFEANEARKAFFAALARFKDMGLSVSKNGHVNYAVNGKPPVDFRHATLSNVCATIGPALSECGLSYRWETKREAAGGEGADKIVVTCILSHILGHSERTELYAYPDSSGGKNSIQSIGSTVSYLERYTLMAATGTAATDQDDDGRGIDGDQDRTEPEKKNTSKELPECSEQYFERLCTDIMDPDKPGEVRRFGIKALVKMGNETPENVIAFVSTKVRLTDSQLKEINSWTDKP